MSGVIKVIASFVTVHLLVACTSSLPVMPTGNAGEYLVVARNSASIFSSLEEAQKEAVNQAMNYCKGLGKVYVKKYVIDRPMAIAQVPESNLYFTCSDSNGVANGTQPVSSNNGSLSMEQAKSKCLDLGFKAGTESFGQCILKVSK
jgi:hypothetical protein